MNLCFGCRVIVGARRQLADLMPTVEIPGMRWERFTCERCGVDDVRLVADKVDE